MLMTLSGPADLKDRVRAGVGVVAIAQAISGAALLFAGSEITEAILGTSAPEPVSSLLGAAFLGFAAMNWIARHNILGGIYGRSVVAANQTHVVVGSFVLARRLLDGSPSAALVIVASGYLVAAIFFTRLMLGTGLQPKPDH